MSRLEIKTQYGVTVELLLYAEDLVEPKSLTCPGSGLLSIAYPDDALSQSMRYWLVMAQGCGLINEYTFQEK